MCGDLCPVKPTNRTLPSFCIFSSSASPPFSTTQSGSLSQLISCICIRSMTSVCSRLQALLDLLADLLRVAGADLGHQEALLPPLAAVGREGLAHDLLAAAVVVVPAVVEERHALVEGGVHDLDGLVLVLDGADVPAAEAEDGDVHAGLAERPRRDALARLLVLRGRGAAERDGGGRGDAGLEELAAGLVRVGRSLMGCSVVKWEGWRRRK